MRRSIEADNQRALFQWIEYQKSVYPVLKLIHAIPNGGSRHKLEAYQLKLQGVKSGVPDIHLPASRNGYIGLYIEMKAGKNKLTENQEEFIKLLREEGNKVEICYTTESAINSLKQYLGVADEV